MAQSPPVVSPIRPQKAPSWRSSHSADSSRRCALLLSGKPRDWPCFSRVIWSASLYNDRLETWLTVDFVAMAAEDSVIHDRELRGAGAQPQLGTRPGYPIPARYRFLQASNAAIYLEALH